MSHLLQIKAIFKGKVQGVFFRKHIKEYADELKIFGYVKNLSDGCVEVVAISDKKTLDKFFEKILSKPGFGTIDFVDKKICEQIQNFSDFKILY